MLQDQQARRASIFQLTTSAAIPSLPTKAIDGQRVLITGAGGSIGSALAHLIAAQNPRQIVLLDASEQSLYRIDRDLAAPDSAVLGSVCDRALLDEVFANHHPQVVFHAAAFKHVPLMEFNPIAALQNNAIGTFILAQTAARYHVEQFVMVSTDKAVEPSSIMGASKRIAELVILAMGCKRTRFKSVRLGNVLASQGSVLPLFQSQIDRGQPLSVTHPQASRYFLTLDHAAQLLLLAISEEFAPSILIPKLGDPIRIEEIATRMLANQPSESRIEFTGLRPGDKLTEKLLSDEEYFLDDRKAPLRPIHSESPSRDELEHAMQQLEQAAQQRNLPQLMRIVGHLVPDYEPSKVIRAAIQAALHQHAPAGTNR
jgi:FlaA1/EpsC-like NDP-sugar epimerase